MMKRRIEENGDSQCSKFRHIEPPENIENKPENHQEEINKTGSQQCICLSTNETCIISNLQETWLNDLKQHLTIICNAHAKNCPNKIISINRTPLHDAIIENNEKLVNSLSTDKNLINSKSNHDLTPLHIASYKGNPKIARILLKNGAAIDEKFMFQQKICIPLDLAIIGCNERMVKLLLTEKSKSINWSQNDLYHLKEKFNTIKAYLQMSDLDSWNENRQITLLNSVENSIVNYRNIAAHLLYIRTNFDNPLIVLREIMYYSVTNGFLKIVEDLLIWGGRNKDIDYTSSINKKPGCTLLHNSVKGELKDVARIFTDLGNRVIINNEISKNHKFLCSLEGCKKKIIELLLQHGAAKKSPQILINILAVPENQEIVKISLYEAPGHILHMIMFGRNEEKNHRVTKINRENTIKFLFEIYGVRKIVDIDAKNKFGDTALIQAVEKSDEIIVDLLLEFGADVDSKKCCGSTALIKATENGNLRIVRALLSKNADIDVKDNNNSTALDIAFQNIRRPGRNFEMIAILLNSGANFSRAKIEHSKRACRSLNFLREHVVKLSAARMDIKESAFRRIINSPILQNFRRVCSEEFEILKERKIGESEFTFYFAMTKRSFLLERISRNRRVADVMEGEDWKVIFPNYWRFVENNYRKGVVRKELMDQALEIFGGLVGVGLCETVQFQILRYLRNKDLKNLVIGSTL